MAALLNINSSAIKILKVEDGSIKVTIQLPQNIAEYFYQLCEMDDTKLFLLYKFFNIKIVKLESSTTQVSREVKPQKSKVITTADLKYDALMKGVTILPELQEIEKRVLSDLYYYKLAGNIVEVYVSGFLKFFLGVDTSINQRQFQSRMTLESGNQFTAISSI